MRRSRRQQQYGLQRQQRAGWSAEILQKDNLSPWGWPRRHLCISDTFAGASEFGLLRNISKQLGSTTIFRRSKASQALCSLLKIGERRFRARSCAADLLSFVCN